MKDVNNVTKLAGINLGMRLTTALVFCFALVAMTGNCSCLGLDRDYLGDVIDANGASKQDTCEVRAVETRG